MSFLPPSSPCPVGLLPAEKALCCGVPTLLKAWEVHGEEEQPHWKNPAACIAKECCLSGTVSLQL